MLSNCRGPCNLQDTAIIRFCLNGFLCFIACVSSPPFALCLWALLTKDGELPLVCKSFKLMTSAFFERWLCREIHGAGAALIFSAYKDGMFFV